MPHQPDPVVRLLWRRHLPQPERARRGPRQKLSVDEVVAAAVDLADAEGLAAVTIRSLAKTLGLGTMSLYTYVPGRSELIALMVDQVLLRRSLPPMPEDVRDRMKLVARVHFDDCVEHPWLLDVAGIRAWLGPGAAERYEWQLSAIEGLGFGDIEMDQTVSLLVGFAGSVARAQHQMRRAEQESGMTELEWWDANAEELGAVMAGHEYPLAARVGAAAGEAYQAASDPVRQLEFGLRRIIDGLLAYLAAKG